MINCNLQGSSSVAVFNKELSDRVQQERELRRDIYRALYSNELSLYYQPIVNSDNEIISLEALVRWDHPTKGMLLPSQFIHIAESSGLIVQLGEWVLRNVCAQAKSWQKEGIENFSISVNISTCHFYSNIAKFIGNLLLEFELSPELLELEITESYIMKDIPQFIQIIKELTSLGVDISIDDFGTGYSSLSYLYQIPAKRIKLDRLFIQSIYPTEEKRASVIVKSIIDLAHLLNMEVVAEGIEEIEQYRAMVQHGCDKFQGYLFSKPISSAKVREIFRKKIITCSRDL